MRNTAKLAFDMLEMELEVLNSEYQSKMFGGYGTTYAPGDSSYDCFFKALDHKFGINSHTYLTDKYGDIFNGGIKSEDVDKYATEISQFTGHTAAKWTDSFGMADAVQKIGGDASLDMLMFFNNGDGGSHVVNATRVFIENGVYKVGYDDYSGSNGGVVQKTMPLAQVAGFASFGWGTALANNPTTTAYVNYTTTHYTTTHYTTTHYTTTY